MRRAVLDAAAAAVIGALPVLLLAFGHGALWPWGDEVQFVDPAARAWAGQGFTSAAWPYQGAHEFFAGNAPGYSLLLVPWFHAFGFGWLQARALVWALAGLAALLLWRALGQWQPGLPAWMRATALAVLFLGAGVQPSLWSARYDMLGLTVVSALALALARPPGRMRRPVLVGLGAALFYAGFHLVVAALVAGALLAWRDRRRWGHDLLAIGAGIALGLGSWLLVLAPQGLAGKFFVMLLGSQHTLSGQMAQLVLHGDPALWRKLQLLAAIPWQDASLAAVALMLGLLAAWRRWRPAGQPLDPLGQLRFATATGVLAVPLALALLGKFPVYYSWLAYAPAVLAGTLLAQRAATTRPSAHAAFAAAAGLLVAVSLAAPGYRELLRHAGGAGMAPLDQWATAVVRSDDVVYSEHVAYFAARARARDVIATTYGRTSLVRGIPEAGSVTLALVTEEALAGLPALLGGEWQVVTRAAVPAGAAGAGLVAVRRVGSGS